METGFIRCQSDNLPKIDIFMVTEFLSKHPLYTSAETRGVKLNKSTQENYSDDAIGYVQLKREGELCTVKARVTPEHKVRNKPYFTTLICNENDENIISVVCDGCAAGQGGCKHVLAFLMWLHRRSEEPACTLIKCYWAKAKMANIGINIKYIKTKDLVKGPQKKVMEKKRNDGSFINEIVAQSIESNINSLLMLYKKPNGDPTLSVHSMACHYKRQCNNLSPDDFLEFCKENMRNMNLQIFADATTEQSKCNLWFELRYGRVTASKLHEVAHCSKANGTLVEQILGAYTFKDTDAIKRGKKLEPQVRQAIIIQKKIQIKECGLILNHNFPMIGASPDGISDEFVIEIKCPSSKKALSIYIKDEEPTKKYMAQLQLQMFFANKNKAFFDVAAEDFESSNNVTVYEVEYNDELLKELIAKTMEFWKKNIYKRVLML